MGWMTGAYVGMGHALGRAEREARRKDSMAADMGEALLLTLDHIDKIEPDALAFKSWIEYVGGNPSQNSETFAIFSTVQPHKVDKDDMTARRLSNLKVIAWAEYFTMVSSIGSSNAKKVEPVIRGLSDAINYGKLDPDTAKDHIVSALNDVADRMKLTRATVVEVDPAVWVADRIEELKKTAKFESGESIPKPESIRPTDPALKQLQENAGRTMDVVGENLCGAEELMI